MSAWGQRKNRRRCGGGDGEHKRVQNSVIIFYTLVLRSSSFPLLLLVQLVYGNCEGGGSVASPTGAGALFRDWATLVIYSSVFHQLLRKD
jgi:hypothetical protein